MLKACKHCKQLFAPRRVDHILCGDVCRSSYRLQLRKERDPNVKWKPMPREQALVNAFLLGRDLEDIEEIVDKVFKRELLSEEETENLQTKESA